VSCAEVCFNDMWQEMLEDILPDIQQGLNEDDSFSKKVKAASVKLSQDIEPEGMVACVYDNGGSDAEDSDDGHMGTSPKPPNPPSSSSSSAFTPISPVILNKWTRPSHLQYVDGTNQLMDLRTGWAVGTICETMPNKVRLQCKLHTGNCFIFLSNTRGRHFEARDCCAMWMGLDAAGTWTRQRHRDEAQCYEAAFKETTCVLYLNLKNTMRIEEGDHMFQG
jgi:hypothetical protein